MMVDQVGGFSGPETFTEPETTSPKPETVNKEILTAAEHTRYNVLTVSPLCKKCGFLFVKQDKSIKCSYLQSE